MHFFCIGRTVKRPTPFQAYGYLEIPPRSYFAILSQKEFVMINPIVKRCAGLDVHKMIIVATVQIEQDDGSITEETKSFGTFRKHRRQLCRWMKKHEVELVIMESTGIFWKSIYESLENASIQTFVVNARHVKQVPGRKTDVKDSQWLATLGRLGLLSPSFIPPKDLRELRMLTRQRQKLKGMLSAETNRLHKVLDDSGIRLGGVVSDINGVSAQEMVQGLIEGKAPAELVTCARGRLKSKAEELLDSLDESLGERHRFLLHMIQDHIGFIREEVRHIDDYIFKAMAPYRKQWEFLQTVPGIDEMGAAMLIVEIGVDMARFGSKENLASWAGMCPGNNESAGKKKSGKTRKGNRAVRKVLCEISNAAIKTKSQFKGKYQGLVVRRGHKRAIVAVGHKILRVVFSLLKNGRAYIDPGIDYESIMVKKNAPRWIQALKKYGHWPEVATKAA
jgi:transposase